ncbi:MAG: hypothetical protein IK020_12055 [Clostridiales bacterium]|nr:hypothetical protein [Clostridiales bacterium]
MTINEKLRNDFLDELGDFYSKGVMPSKASVNMRHALTEHQKRLAKKGLSFSERFDHVIDERSSAIPHESGGFVMYNSHKHCNAITALTDSVRTIKCDEASDDVVYCHIIDRKDPAARVQDEERVIQCPNCGNSGAAKLFVDGCPSCGTKFQINDMYPCVSSYYTMPWPMPKQNSVEEGMHVAAIIGVVVGILIGVLVAVLMIKDQKSEILIGLVTIVAALLGGWATFLISFLISNAVISAKAVTGLAKMTLNTLDLAGAQKSKRNTEAAVTPYDPNFAFDVFEGKIISSIRTIAYSDDRSRCSLYAGSDDLSFMDDLVNIRYRGACGFHGAALVGNFLQVAMTVYLDNIYYRNGEFFRAKENFNVVLSRRADVRTPVEFTAYSVNCPRCAGTYDSILSRQCPYCGNNFVMATHDWMIVQLTRQRA